MIPGLTTFTNTTAALSLARGFILGLGAGTDKIITGVDGWDKGAPMRRNKTARMNQHGTFAEPAKRDERTVSVSGSYRAPNRAAAAAFVDLINAYLGAGELGVLEVTDPDLGTRRATVQLLTPDVTWSGGVDVEFTLDLSAPDPRKYGDPVTASTGVPKDGGGLTFDLFGGAIETKRINLAAVPSFESAVWSGGPNWTRTSSAEQSWSGAKSMKLVRANTTPGNGYAVLSVPGVVAGIEMTVSAYFYGGSGLYSLMAGGAAAPALPKVDFTAPGNAWVRKHVTFTPSVSGTMDVYIHDDGNGAPSAGATLYMDAVLIEVGALGTYFDGSTAASGDAWYGWSGAANGSTSLQYGPAETSSFGILDFGLMGDEGAVAFTNPGSADAPTRFRVDGYAPGFTITETVTGRRLVYTASVPAGQYLTLDPVTGLVLLNGDPNANRSEYLTVREWTRTPGGGRSNYLFESGGPNAVLTLEGVPAWW